VLVLLVWAPVPAASDPIIATILIALGAVGIEALRRLVIRDFPDHTERDLGHRLGRSMHSAWGSISTSSPSTRADTPAPAGTRYAELEQLVSLHERGALTDAEFAAEKAAVLTAAP
jgi:hypothetical protein